MKQTGGGLSDTKLKLNQYEERILALFGDTLYKGGESEERGVTRVSH